MKLFSKLFGDNTKKDLKLREFVGALAMVAVDLPAIKQNLAVTGLPLGIQHDIRDDIIFLQIFAIEIALNAKFDEHTKSKVMDLFYDVIFKCFGEIQKGSGTSHNVSLTIASGLDRTMPAYYQAAKDSTSDDDMLMSVGKAFASMAGYPFEPQIVEIGTSIFHNSIKAVLSLWQTYNIIV